MSGTVLICLLLPILVSGSTAQQDPLCTDSYAEFESASVGSNDSGRDIRNQLYKAFYAPNRHLPYSVLVTYQLVLTNGTRVNFSSDPHCSSELWAWLSSPVFLYYSTTLLNRLLLFTLNYFMEHRPPHIIISMSTAPCSDKTLDFLNEMTASLQDYALGQMEYKTKLGYVKRGCGTSHYDTLFSPIQTGLALDMVFNISVPAGLVCQSVFVWIVSVVLLKTTFKVQAEKTFTYSYDVYGLFWGISSTAMGLLGILCGVYAVTAYSYITYKKPAVWPSGILCYLMLSALLFVMVAELPVAIYIATKSTVAVPGIFKYPATLLCCGRKRRAERFVTTLALWVDLVTLQLVLLQASLIMFALSAAPFAIITNVLLVVLALTCIANILSLLFTIFAHLRTPSSQQVHSHFMILRAVVMLPLLLMIIWYGVVFAAMGSATNMDAKSNNNILSFINSIATPILLGLLVIFLKKFISAWLKWSPPEIEQETTQEVDEELLHP